MAVEVGAVLVDDARSCERKRGWRLSICFIV